MSDRITTSTYALLSFAYVMLEAKITGWGSELASLEVRLYRVCPCYKTWKANSPEDLEEDSE